MIWVVLSLAVVVTIFVLVRRYLTPIHLRALLMARYRAALARAEGEPLVALADAILPIRADPPLRFLSDHELETLLFHFARLKDPEALFAVLIQARSGALPVALLRDESNVRLIVSRIAERHTSAGSNSHVG